MPSPVSVGIQILAPPFRADMTRMAACHPKIGICDGREWPGRGRDLRPILGPPGNPGRSDLVDDDGRVLYLVISGAPAPEGIPALVAACQTAGWRVVVFATPAGIRFVDPAELARLTGELVRSEYRMPGTGAPVPSADAVLACPLTFNSVNKFAHGHADNFALSLLCE